MNHFSHFFRLYAAVLLLVPPALIAADLTSSLDVVEATNRSASASQQKIDELSRDTRLLLDEYRRLRNSADYQAAYTRELEQLEQAQQQTIASLQQQIAEARITRQRIVPLMRSMAQSLEKFVLLDLPFHHEERIAAVLQLKQRLQQPGLSVSAKFRLLLEAYQLEQDYGVTIEAWRGPLQSEDDSRSVEYLRIGRVALYFQSLDGRRSAYWDALQGDWLSLDAGYSRSLAEAIRVAKNRVAPQLLTLPMAGPGGES